MIRTSIEAFEINPPPPIDDTPRRPSQIPEIIDLMEGRKAPMAEILHHITIEIAYLVNEMASCLRRGAPLSESKSYFDQIKGLRAVFKHLIENCDSATRDALDIDGPQFQCAFGEIVGCLTEALEHVTIKPKEDHFNQMILREFRDRLAVRHLDIQRKVAEVYHKTERTYSR